MYHTLSDYRDQNKNYSNQPIQSKNITNSKSNLTTMKKGTMVNGSEVYYGKGIKVDPSKYKSNKANINNNMKRINKKIINNNVNKIGRNRAIQYVAEEEKIVNKTVVVNKKVEKFDENVVDLNKPHCFISVRMYNGTVIRTEFNSDKKLRDVYLFVKKMGKNNIIDFILLDGFPPKPLTEFDKTKAVNRYLTTEIYMERTSIERLFWDLLSYKFKSDEHRKILKENFMFFKEICLFAIYKSILAKDNPDLYSRVTGNLKSKLSEDGYEKYDKNRREYFSIFSQKFGEAFNETKDINQSLRFSFWSTLASMYPDWITLEKIADILSNNYLFKIFQYSYDAINISYQAYKEKSI